MKVENFCMATGAVATLAGIGLFMNGYIYPASGVAIIGLVLIAAVWRDE